MGAQGPAPGGAQRDPGVLHGGNGLTGLAANIGFSQFDETINRAIGGIEYQMLLIPGFIVALRYVVPARQFVTADVGSSAFNAPPVQSRVATDHLDLDDMCRVLQGGLPPAGPACQHRIYAIGNDGAAKLEIFSGKSIRNGVSHDPNCETCTPQGLLNSIDPEIGCGEPLCQLASDRRLPDAGKAAEHETQVVAIPWSDPGGGPKQACLAMCSLRIQLRRVDVPRYFQRRKAVIG